MARDREPGDKLLPKVMHGVSQTVIATKLGLTGHEFNLRVNAGQELINRMGHEVADLIEPLFREALNDERLSPGVRDFLTKMSSGADQWQAALGVHVLSSGTSGSLGTILDDALAPFVRDIVRKSPNLAPNPETLAQMYAQRFLVDNNYIGWVEGQGFQQAFADAWMNLAQTWPDLTTIQTLRNRGIVDEGTARGFLGNAGIPEIHNAYYEQLWTNILSVQDAALAVLRTDITLDQGREIARANGYTNADFDVFMANTGEPPGAQELMEALRRGFINEARFRLGIAQSRVRNEWQDTLLALRYSPIATADAVNAYVEGYISESDVAKYADANGLEPEQYKILTQAAGDPLSYTDMMRLWRYGKATEQDVKDALRRGRLKDNYIDFALALKDAPMSVPDAIEASIQGYLPRDQAAAIAAMNGLRAEDFEPLLLTAGDPLSKTEMIELWRRGQVTQDQVEAALRQSRLKDSYIPAALLLKRQLPALYETRALLAAGGLTAEQGTEILLASGYDKSIVTAIVSNAIGQTTAIHKQLTEAMYADLYKERSITASEFQDEIKALGYTEAQGELIQAIYDNQVAITNRNSAITRIRAAYTGHKIQEADAQNQLNELGVTSAMVDQLITDWNIIIETEVKLLTAAQVTDYWFQDGFNPGDPADNTTQALDYLVKLGYSATDALVLLELKNKGPLTNGGQGKPVSSQGGTGSSGTAS